MTKSKVMLIMPKILSQLKKLIKSVLLLGKNDFWYEDTDYSFQINDKVITSYFNKTQSLVFTEDGAQKEEEAILPCLDLEKEPRVLDLGAGNGRWAKILIPRCKKYVGVDIAIKFVENARRKYTDERVQFLCMAAQDYLAEEKYDLILAIGLTTYMNEEDIRQMAGNCKKMLSENGALVVRSVTLKENETKRKVYNRKANLAMRLLRKPSYQIIRRTDDEEISLFSIFTLESQTNIARTEYTFYIFK